ncbi:anti-sigma factor [Acidimangrovimonas sediminis]|uniref:anti-sigma factor n=1 Tax=Acidimangrovimonas sediminis TaxID=2056283 RepID=UPI000C80E502|nr:anti-sigma factor [Acidimangrovimonas sediminis]
MTTPQSHIPEGGDDLLAAEYVLGVLPLPERLAVEARLRDDPAFAERVAAWSGHLSSLDADFPEVPAPDLLPQIEARLFGRADPAGQRASGRRGLGRRWFLAGGGAIAAAAAVGVFLTRPGKPQLLMAEIAAQDGALIFQARYDPGTGIATITRTRGQAPGDAHDYELWIIHPGQVPSPAGLVSAPTRRLTLPKLAAGDTLAVSLEPAGGSPNGKPTQVLGAGVLSLA